MDVRVRRDSSRTDGHRHDADRGARDDRFGAAARQSPTRRGQDSRTEWKTEANRMGGSGPDRRDRVRTAYDSQGTPKGGAPDQKGCNFFH